MFTHKDGQKKATKQLLKRKPEKTRLGYEQGKGDSIVIFGILDGSS